MEICLNDHISEIQRDHVFTLSPRTSTIQIMLQRPPRFQSSSYNNSSHLDDRLYNSTDPCRHVFLKLLGKPEHLTRDRDLALFLLHLSTSTLLCIRHLDSALHPCDNPSSRDEKCRHGTIASGAVSGDATLCIMHDCIFLICPVRPFSKQSFDDKLLAESPNEHITTKLGSPMVHDRLLGA